jgi:hypothetical protein
MEDVILISNVTVLAVLVELAMAPEEEVAALTITLAEVEMVGLLLIKIMY